MDRMNEEDCQPSGVGDAATCRDPKTESEDVEISSSAIKVQGNRPTLSTDNHAKTSSPSTENTPNPPKPASDSRKPWTQRLLALLQTHWFLLALALLIALASQAQVPLAHQNLKKTAITYTCIPLIFLLTGLTLPARVLLQNYSRYRLHLFTQLQCFLLTSAITFGIAVAAGTKRRFMDPGLLVGLVFMGCVATTISSNVVMTRQAGGNTAATVVQTTLGNFVGVFLTPALVGLYLSTPGLWWTGELALSGSGAWGEVYRRVLFQLGLSLYLPLVVGQVVQWRFPEVVTRVCVQWKVAKLGSVCLLVVLWGTYDQAFAVRAFTSVPGDNMVFVVFVSVGLFAVFFGIALATALPWLDRRDVVAVCYCVPAKGIAMAVPLSQGTFRAVSREMESKILIPIIVYQGLQLVFGAMLVGVFKKWIEQGERRTADTSSDREGGREEGQTDASSTKAQIGEDSNDSAASESHAASNASKNRARNSKRLEPG